WWTRFVSKPMERSTFVLITSAVFVLMFWQWRPIPAVVWDVQPPAARAALYGLFIAGMLIVLLSSFLIDHFDLFGLRQVFLHLRGRDYTQKPFVERSLYKLVRHPLMLGFLIAFWSAPTMTVGHLLFSALMTAYIVIGVRMEERDLLAQHSAAYADYRRRTPMLLPRLRRPAKATGSATAA
ncbi:MAG: isoprenylcysteine carboxylmethyltransferase family protein, partial [Gemmatimonadetes bacterium]|nr:isoprenylcysteine carboxylmethyltransferase family protein [Gemmatimonadota bacterium]